MRHHLETRNAPGGDVLAQIQAAFAENTQQVQAMAERMREMEAHQDLLITRASRPGAGASLPADGRGGNPQTKAKQLDELRQFMKIGTRAIQTGVGADGGYALPEEIDRIVTNQMIALSPMRSVARVVRASSSDFKSLVGLRTGASAWVGETDTRNATNTPTLGEVAPTSGTLMAYPAVTEEALQDIFFNVEDWLKTHIADEFGLAENIAFTTGNGTDKPTGFLAGTAPVATTDASRAFGTLQYTASGQASAMPTSADTLVDFMYSLAAPYRANGTWMMNSVTASIVRKYKDTTNQYLWQNSMQLGQPESLLGRPVIINENMPAIGANTFPVAFGDFRAGYLVVDLSTSRVTRDEVTQPGYVKFYVRKRVGGKILDSNAIKLLKIATS
jgi:HK97 family phage major capsid protein